MDLGQLLQTAAHVAQAFTPTGSASVVDLLAPWVQSLSRSAPGRWLPVLAEHAACAHRAGSRRCGARAVVACVACGKRVCLEHALVGADANAVCHECVTDVASRKRTEPRSQAQLRAEPVPKASKAQRKVAAGDVFAGFPAQVRAGYELLGCLPADTDDEVQAAFNLRMKFAKSQRDKVLYVKSFEAIAAHRAA